MMLCLSDKGQVSVSRGRSSACRILRNPASAHSSPLANQRGIRVPLQVSLICTDPDPAFAWSAPALSHIHWEAGPLVRRINRWAGKCQPGKARPFPDPDESGLLPRWLHRSRSGEITICHTGQPP